MNRTISKPWLVLGLLSLAAILGIFFANGLATSTQAGHNPPVDVVFIIDESGSMGNEIVAVQNNVNFIAANLDPPFHPSFGLVGYGAIASHTTGFGGVGQGAHTHTDLPTDAAGLATALGGMVASGGIEAGVQATIDTLSNLNFTNDPSCIILITDEDSDGGSLATANADLATQGSVWFGIVALGAGNTAINYGPDVGSMSDTTGGAVFGIANFANDPQPVLTALLSECQTAVLEGDRRMTGGGSFAGTTPSVTFRHGFELHCNLSQPNRLEINWGKGKKFHLTQLDSATCSDDANLDEGKPVAGFDTFEGSGIGRMNGVDGVSISFKFTDDGEPGKAADWAEIDIGGGTITAAGFLDKGNQQAHQ